MRPEREPLEQVRPEALPGAAAGVAALCGALSLTHSIRAAMVCLRWWVSVSPIPNCSWSSATISACLTVSIQDRLQVHSLRRGLQRHSPSFPTEYRGPLDGPVLTGRPWCCLNCGVVAGFVPVAVVSWCEGPVRIEGFDGFQTALLCRGY